MSRFHSISAAALLAIALVAPLRAAIDPALLQLAPPDSRILIGMQLPRVLASPFGRFALAQMPDQNAILLQLAAATGFDLRRDLAEVLIAGPGHRGKLLRDSVVLARGSFQTDRLLAFAGKIHATVETYSGLPLITPADAGASTVAILDSSTLAVGSPAELKGIVNRRAQRFFFSGALADKARVASADADAWAVTETPLASFVRATSGGVWPAAFLQSVVESTVGLRFGLAGIDVSADALTHSPQEATALAGLFKALTGMMKGSQSGLLQTARFSTGGASTRISLTVSEEDLERAFPVTAQKRAAR